MISLRLRKAVLGLGRSECGVKGWFLLLNMLSYWQVSMKVTQVDWNEPRALVIGILLLYF